MTPLTGKKPIHKRWQYAPMESEETAVRWARSGNVGQYAYQAQLVIGEDREDECGDSGADSEPQRGGVRLAEAENERRSHQNERDRVIERGMHALRDESWVHGDISSCELVFHCVIADHDTASGASGSGVRSRI